MNRFLLATLLLCGCPGGSDDEPDTTDPVDTDEPAPVDTGPVPFGFADAALDHGVEVSCSGGWCAYRAAFTHPAGLVELDLTETGHAGRYSENHSGFTLESVRSDGAHVYRLYLAWVTDAADVVANETTLFNPDAGDGDVLSRTTWYFGGLSEDMLDSDCVVTGHDPGHYADWCVAE